MTEAVLLGAVILFAVWMKWKGAERPGVGRSPFTFDTQEWDGEPWERRLRTWRSRTDWGNHNLSVNMRSALQAAAGDAKVNSNVDKRTFSALKRRELIRDDGSLTQKGFIQAVAASSLTRQCELLQLEFKEVSGESDSKPEEVAQAYYGQELWDVYWDEGAIIKELLNVIVWPRLVELGKHLERKWENETAGMTIRDPTGMVGKYVYNTSLEDLLRDPYVSDRPNIKGKILREIREVSKNDVESYLGERRAARVKLREFHSGSSHPRWPKGAVIDLFVALQGTTLSEIVRTFMKDPIAFSAGWPDLLLLKSDEVRWSEVKKNDTLTHQQIITMPEMRTAADLEMKVVRVR